jgi:3'(2'), 5'-bisphosphate nucleotidase
MPYEHELQVALEAASAASQTLLQLYAAFEAVADAPADISTAADKQSQEIILGHLRRAFPQDAFCAEEQTGSLAGAANTGRRLWIVDPIDGTRGFARKNGEFSVMVGFVEDGRIGVGVVMEPALGRLTYALHGGGCWQRDGDTAAAPCQVSSVAELAQATLIQSHSRNPANPGRMVKALRPARVIETYSAGIKLARVARGEADLYLNTYSEFHDWDICAGHILVTEASGRATGLAGQELRYGREGAWQRNGLLASNGVLHEPALKALELAAKTSHA